MSKESANTIILTVQTICLIMGLFFGWLNTKMELPDGAIYFWFWLGIFCLPLYYIVNRKPKQR